MKSKAMVGLFDSFPSKNKVMTCNGAKSGATYKILINDHPKAIGWYKEKGVVKGIEIELDYTCLDTVRNGKPNLTLV